ncbi:type II toxin-antitoxin system PemK/MazF family toxin [Lacticaseibacillus saniviri]|uniref:Uncharacterized protein n=1 Tax=Lacticaseibacillus saniviri JCM 17471 = DSM 24301 TaxID=1293598 RepID=A0A0R2MTS9_9LACO|nr:type II toxin-antitoxin system PemK/MazF family toxin [Lacticaseibacillus saniviri]KRO16825.1 hypothetical protein IV56_GL000706 [Lacticaseibacillus saniviri JCM 17471 = DSM 24301]MCG4283067.1 type II toxin-antitoxin system PemK/MazF family toxin [Lacticaseibacillus saniviri]
MYIPKQGDIVYLSFDPSVGHEIRKRRPALIVSKDEFNHLTGFCLACPITSTQRPFGTYVNIVSPGEVKGDIVTHQLRSMDYTKRDIQFVEHVDPTTWAKTLAVVRQFI